MVSALNQAMQIALGAAHPARIRSLGALVLDALLPPRCMACGEAVLSHGTACPDCFAALKPLQPPQCGCCGVPFVHEGQAADPLVAQQDHSFPVCERCAKVPPVYRQAKAAFLYDAGSKRLLLPLKHGDRTELARPLARHMARAGRDLLGSADLLLPVPLHPKRLLWRRYNQAALLTKNISRLSGVPWAPMLLLRKRRTPPLGPMNAFERAQVLKGAFALAPGGEARIAGHRLVLIDDVLTSGATVSACASMLLAAGARSVDVLAAARVPDPRLAKED